MKVLSPISAEGHGDYYPYLFQGKISPIPPTSLKGSLSPRVLTRKTEFLYSEASARRFFLLQAILMVSLPSPFQTGFLPASSAIHIWPQEYPWSNSRENHLSKSYSTLFGRARIV